MGAVGGTGLALPLNLALPVKGFVDVAARAEAPITTTGRLASIIRSVTPRDPSGMDRATRSFQALRLAVNDELGEVERGLDAAAKLLAPGGRLVVVAFGNDLAWSDTLDGALDELFGGDSGATAHHESHCGRATARAAAARMGNHTVVGGEFGEKRARPDRSGEACVQRR